ncbi:MAG: PhnA domain-containing protein [Flavobacteriales bacterium]
MSISQALKDRSNGMCELCAANEANIEFTVSPKSDETIDHQVALCEQCSSKMGDTNEGFYWRCLEGSIWSPYPSVQALSYRLLNDFAAESWAADAMNGVELDESVVQWALTSDKPMQHIDAFGNVLNNGDNVVLTQALDVKGTNFTASKGTVVKRIKLIHDNAEQIEGKINEQSIIILTKYVKKN